MFLMAVAAMTIFATGTLGPRDPAMLAIAARAMLVISAFGLGVLWPMVRLSQTSPEHPIGACFADVVAINAPLQALIWPLGLLTNWSPWVLGALALTMVSWSMLVGSLLAVALRGEACAWSRLAWMALFVALTLGTAGLLALLETMGAPIDPALWLASPLTAPSALTAHESGLPVVIEPVEWAGAAGPGAVSAPVWALAGVAKSLRRRSLARNEA
jgi:hypothetical protein